MESEGSLWWLQKINIFEGRCVILESSRESAEYFDTIT